MNQKLRIIATDEDKHLAGMKFANHLKEQVFLYGHCIFAVPAESCRADCCGQR